MVHPAIYEIGSYFITDPMPSPPDSKDRRRETRASVDRNVTVTILPSLQSSFPGRLINISSFGLGLRLYMPIKANTSVSVEWDNEIALGTIVYSFKDNSEYRAGFKTDYTIIDRTRSSDY